MKQIQKMSDEELRDFSLSLHGLAEAAFLVSENLYDIECDDKKHGNLTSLYNDVVSFGQIVFWWETQKCKDYTRRDIESYINQMMKLCKNISVNLSHRFSELFGWTELDIHEVINGEV